MGFDRYPNPNSLSVLMLVLNVHDDKLATADSYYHLKQLLARGFLIHTPPRDNDSESSVIAPDSFFRGTTPG